MLARRAVLSGTPFRKRRATFRRAITNQDVCARRVLSQTEQPQAGSSVTVRAAMGHTNDLVDLIVLLQKAAQLAAPLHAVPGREERALAAEQRRLDIWVAALITQHANLPAHNPAAFNELSRKIRQMQDAVQWHLDAIHTRLERDRTLAKSGSLRQHRRA